MCVLSFSDIPTYTAQNLRPEPRLSDRSQICEPERAEMSVPIHWSINGAASAIFRHFLSPHCTTSTLPTSNPTSSQQCPRQQHQQSQSSATMATLAKS